MFLAIKYVKVFGNFEAFHCWEKHNGYLKNLHRHNFGVVLQIEVNHNDRELEFYETKYWLKQYLKNNFEGTTSDFSCEAFADKIAEAAEMSFGKRNLIIEVNEDDQEGAVCYYEPKK